MSKKDEAMKLALEALEFEAKAWEVPPKPTLKAITALREALAQQPAYRAVKTFHEGKPVYVAEQPAQQALDKMAENARELGLDYEPVWNNLPSNKDVEDAMRLKRLSQLAEQPAQQEPVACLVETEQGVMLWPIEDINEAENYCEENEFPVLLYTSPPAQRTWVGLTDEEVDEWTPEIHSVIRAIEAKLREKNA